MSSRVWLMAARPKTLAGAVAPVAVGLAQAWYQDMELAWLPAALCVAFALGMQVTANYVNDLVDFRRGRDNGERLGPLRACQAGLATPRAMLVASVVAAAVSCACGLPLVLWGGWPMVVVGAVCVLFAVLYSTCLAQKGWGDVLVVVFFGLVPVCCTFYIQTGILTMPCVWLGLGMGLATDTMLAVNNHRDMEQDAAHGKRTVAAILGREGSLGAFLMLGTIASFLVQCALPKPAPTLMLIYLGVHYINFRRMHHMRGRELNKLLGHVSLSVLLFATLTCIAILS